MDESKLTRVPLWSWDVYTRTKEYLVSTKADFKVITCGNVEKLVWQDKEYMYVDKDAVGGNGHHLSKFFKADCDAWLLKNAESMSKWDKNYKEQMINVNAIERNIGVPLVMIDINDCYWRTSYLLGYITEETYERGIKVKDWKVGRNACIGGLAKTLVVSDYRNGKVGTRRVERPKAEYQYIRNHIIGHIHTIFNNMFSQMGNAFFMMLTDCLVTTYGNLKYVESELRSNGYRVKHKPLEFTALDKPNRKISWIDFKDKGRDGSEGFREKYYIYADHQVIVSELVDTTEFFKPKVNLG